MLTISSGELPPDAESVVAAREIVASVTEHLPRKAREAAALVTSELATNSVVHARTPFEVFAAADDEIVEVVVADRAGWAPTSRHGSNSLGNGLLPVRLLPSDRGGEAEGGGARSGGQAGVGAPRGGRRPDLLSHAPSVAPSARPGQPGAPVPPRPSPPANRSAPARPTSTTASPSCISMRNASSRPSPEPA